MAIHIARNTNKCVKIGRPNKGIFTNRKLGKLEIWSSRAGLNGNYNDNCLACDWSDSSLFNNMVVFFDCSFIFVPS